MFGWFHLQKVKSFQKADEGRQTQRAQHGHSKPIASAFKLRLFSIRLWTLNNNACVDTLVGHTHHVLDIEVYDEGARLASAI